MELSALLNAGGIAAIAANAFNGMILLIAARLRGATSYPTAQEQLFSLLLHLAAGVGLGLMFWLSWGFTAIVAVPWWQRGIAFAMVVWTVVCIPTLIQIAAARAAQWSALLSTALQWLVSIAAVGLACAWSWQRSSY